VRTFLGRLEAPVGPLIAAATDASLCLLEFSDAATVAQRTDELGRPYSDSVCAGSNAILDEPWRIVLDLERGQSRLPF
jgi:hypothetical protein